jgi:hypothetical protein
VFIFFFFFFFLVLFLSLLEACRSVVYFFFCKIYIFFSVKYTACRFVVYISTDVYIIAGSLQICEIGVLMYIFFLIKKINLVTVFLKTDTLGKVSVEQYHCSTDTFPKVSVWLKPSLISDGFAKTVTFLVFPTLDSLPFKTDTIKPSPF